MKTILIMLALIGAVFATFTATTPFPTSMTAGSSYQATYTDSIDNPYFVSIMTDLMCDEVTMTLNVVSCDCNNSMINCTGNSLPANFNLTLVPNLMPGNYSINITASGTQTSYPAAGPGSSNGGGSVGGGGGASAPSTESVPVSDPVGAAEVDSRRSVNYDEATGYSTYSLVLYNNQNTGTGPIEIREHIPTKVAENPEDLTFSLQPDWFEHGSVIAVWNLTKGIPAGGSFAVDYKVKKRTFVLSGFETSVKTVKVPPVQPVLNETVVPVVLPKNESKPVVIPIVVKNETVEPQVSASIYSKLPDSNAILIMIGVVVIAVVGIAVIFLRGKPPKVISDGEVPPVQ